LDSNNYLQASKMQPCLKALGGTGKTDIQFIDTHYGHRDFLDEICRKIDPRLTYDRVRTEEQDDKCANGTTAFMYPSNCPQLIPCESDCTFNNFDGFYCYEKTHENYTIEQGMIKSADDTSPTAVGKSESMEECINSTIGSEDLTGVVYGTDEYDPSKQMNCWAFSLVRDLAIVKTASNSSLSSFIGDQSVRQIGERCGSGWDGTSESYCGECADGLQCKDESNLSNTPFGCGRCMSPSQTTTLTTTSQTETPSTSMDPTNSSTTSTTLITTYSTVPTSSNSTNMAIRP